jgi:type II secretory pathway component PulC
MMRELFGHAVAGGRRAPAALLCLTGLAIIGYAGARWMMGDQLLAFPAWGMGTSVAVPAEHSHAGSLPAGSQFRPLIFGEIEPVQPGGHLQPGIVSDLELAGVFMSGRVSMAIIADAGGRENVYRIGDQIRAGVTLAEVSWNGVVVAHGDLRQRLPLTGRASAENPPPGNGQATSSREEMPPVVTPSASGATAGPRHRPNFSPEVRRQGMIVPDPDGGFQLKKVMPDSLYARMGLRTGDVLRGMNGRPIDSPEQLMLLYQQLSEGGQGNVELLREGRPEALQFGGS